MKLYLYNKSNLNSNFSLLFYLNKFFVSLELFPTQVIFVFPFPIHRLTYTSHLCFPIWFWRPSLYFSNLCFPIWLCKSLLYSFELRMRSKRRRLMPKHNTQINVLIAKQTWWGSQDKYLKFHLNMVPKIVFYSHWSLYVPFFFFNLSFLIILLYSI